MLVYQATKEKFSNDILSNNIENIIADIIKVKLNFSVPKNQILAFKNSLIYMDKVIADPDIPSDSGVAIEFQIPQTSKRVDFILTGQDDKKDDQVIIIELKQWEEAQITEKDGVVITRFAHGTVEASHPSYQAWSYAALINGFNEAVYDGNITLNPCAYLHNYKDNGVITDPFYKEYLDKAPAFLKNDALKLRDFIKTFVKYGDKTNIMYRIEAGKIRPSKALSDSLSSMLKGNQEFVMIDDQKIVYETALSLARKSSEKNKNVLIVQGGPGTGKSVVAINLLVQATKAGLVAKYVTKNSAPRDVYASKLTGTLKRTEFSNLFSGSGSFVNCPENSFDFLIIDEAHRLNEKSGMFKNLGENQVKEIIKSSKCSVFFIDEDQRVTLNDIGSQQEITKWAEDADCRVHTLELASQFRCNGSDGYLAWLDNSLQIRETANVRFENIDYDFQIIDSPSELRDIIFEKNKLNNKARLVAGYCWNWVSKKNKNDNDIVIPEFDFKMRWNLATDGNLWIIKPESVNEIGCIHTCQGLDLDYVGVVVGDDLVVRDGRVLVDPSKRAGTDKSLNGFKKMLKDDPEEAKKHASLIIRNTYRTLMTRGMKGCYVYFTDNETREYFKLLM
ncbi:MAG: DUF2075 domain-containing protein [Patescibacteria group bacterium]|nr:DUF2075 domain-containing protein [Patescibacteria group bacterium]